MYSILGYEIVYNFGFLYLVGYSFNDPILRIGESRLNMFIVRRHPKVNAVQYQKAGAVQLRIFASTNPEFISFESYTQIKIL